MGRFSVIHSIALTDTDLLTFLLLLESVLVNLGLSETLPILTTLTCQTIDMQLFLLFHYLLTTYRTWVHAPLSLLTFVICIVSHPILISITRCLLIFFQRIRFWLHCFLVLPFSFLFHCFPLLSLLFPSFYNFWIQFVLISLASYGGGVNCWFRSNVQ